MGKFSVIIPAYRRHPLTVKHVEECLKSNWLPTEIVVVNDGGDPSLREMLSAIRPDTKIIYARITEDILWNYNGAVNLGVWLSTGDPIVIEDTDHIPERDLYKESLKFLDKHPEVNRVAYRRKCVDISDVMFKPMEEWQVIGGWGHNQMVTMLRREVYLKLKGQDERFAGAYGWMAYDWPHRYKKAGVVSGSIPILYWGVVDGGEPGMKRGLSSRNREFYKENARRQDFQHPQGILNFNFTYEVL